MDKDLFEDNNQEPIARPLTALALDSSATEAGQPGHVTPDTGVAAIFGFRVGTLGFLLETDIFCEIVDQNKVSPMPNVHPWLNGVLNLRGNIVPVIDLHVLLDEPANAKNRHLLATDRGKKTVAVLIDGYPQMISTGLRPLPNAPALPDILKQAVTAYQQLDNQPWLTLSLERLFKALSANTVLAKG